MKKNLLQNHEGHQKEAAQEMQVLKQPCTAELPTGRPLAQSVREKLLNMIEGKSGEKPLILTIESYPGGSHKALEQGKI